ncbi:MEDS domain-containing protein [Bacillus sp. B1-b2]|uniref:MEDS domain-containing protein n=1 Tax=Bacillus sp. B1-b2 TaxID=2653201 RepID=UPI001261934C|nr:MEDS domain-containing protein [Bacillus sp. B1-b2]KAB7671207.1 3-ketoacyl-ACP reductase [Bacillus sp. B1-b2]
MSHTNITLQTIEKAHIFYLNKSLHQYIDKVTSYILTGINKLEHVFLIENDRIFSLIMKNLPNSIMPEEMKRIHHINNYDYYFSSGSFNPPYIFEYLNNELDYYMQNKLPFRIWAHVEWAADEGVKEILVEFEREADEIVQNNQILLICAYEEDRLSLSLKEPLMSCHEYIMTDDDLVLSTNYRKK